MTTCVLVTEKEYHKGKPTFDAAEGLDIRPTPANEQALADEIRRLRPAAVILGVDRYVGPLYAALSQSGGKDGRSLVARFGVGCDGIDLEQAVANGVLVTNTPGVLDQSVAEHTLWLIGALARNIVAGDAAMRSNAFPAGRGMEMAGKTIGIIGFGPIGQRLARMAHCGLSMNVLAADLLPLETLAERTGSDPKTLQEITGVKAIDSDTNAVIEEADVVSIHLPALSATKHFFDASRFARFKPGALLINTARGMLIDEIALYDALDAGTLAGAALDVFESEPYYPQESGKDLRSLANVVLTPHAGSSTAEANRRMAHACVANVASFLENRDGDMSLVSSPRAPAGKAR